MRTLFFDVETNNQRNDRICQIAIICDEDGREVYKKSWLVNPESEYSIRTINVHGITPDMTRNAPIFPDVWHEIHSYFESSLIVGQNVSFDLAVLDKVFQYYGIKFDALNYVDTMTKAKRCLKGLDKYGLRNLCDYFGIALDNHHDAMCDTEACRNVFYALNAFAPWTSSDTNTYWFGTANLKADPQDLESAMLDLDGIIYGISADGICEEREFLALQRWEKQYNNYRKCEAFNLAFSLVDNILREKTITPDDRYYIHRLSVEYQGKNYSRTTIALQQLKGIVNGIIADGLINENEVISLKGWMLQNIALKGNYPFDSIFELIEKVMEDRRISTEEHNELMSIFRKFVNPLEKQVGEVTFEGKTCCLTGNFTCGSKEEVGERIISLGGIVVPSVTKKTDLLIVGGEGSSAWAYGNYGSKVKKALQMQEDGHSIEIISEADLGG